MWWRPAFGVYEGVDKQYLQILRKNLIKNKLLIGNSFNFCYAHTNIKIYKEIMKKIKISLIKTKEQKILKKNYKPKISVRS